MQKSDPDITFPDKRRTCVPETDVCGTISNFLRWEATIRFSYYPTTLYI